MKIMKSGVMFCKDGGSENPNILNIHAHDQTVKKRRIRNDTAADFLFISPFSWSSVAWQNQSLSLFNNTIKSEKIGIVFESLVSLLLHLTQTTWSNNRAVELFTYYSFCTKRGR
jgi:hypothetical protein